MTFFSRRGYAGGEVGGKSAEILEIEGFQERMRPLPLGERARVRGRFRLR